MIKRDISELPRSQGVDGTPPSKNNFVAQRLADAWFQQYIDEGHMDKARAIPELPYRASYASMRCDRQLFYALAEEPASEPFTVASAWAMGLGTLVHEHLQDAVHKLFPDAVSEEKIDLTKIGIPGSGHCDLIVNHNDERVLVELKTTGGFSFKAMAGLQGTAKGPRYSYLLQAGMLAAALGIDKVVIALLAMESASPNVARQNNLTEAERFSAEWHYHIDELWPYIHAEADRIEEILDDVRNNRLPARLLRDPEVSEGGQVTNPLAPGKQPWMVREPDADGNLVVTDTGTSWFCDYCQWRTTCANAGE